MSISNQTIFSELSKTISDSQLATVAAPRARRRSSRRNFNTNSLIGYVAAFLSIIAIVAVSYRPSAPKPALANTGQLSSTAAATDETIVGSVDQLMATTVGANLADATGLPVANNVANLSQSLVVESSLSQTSTDTIIKPQNLQLGADSRTIKQYTTVTGDTVSAVAAKYNLTAQTVRWANNLTSDALEPGKTLTIPFEDGVLYTVKSGDTIDGIATKYKSDKNIIIHDNDLEVSGLVVGSKIMLSGGELPANERPGYVAPRVVTNNTNNYGYGNGSSTSSNLSASVGNRYAWGNCTWYAYERRQQLGRPVGSFWGNASTWAYNAQRAGYQVDNSPAAGAVMENGGGYGHVAVVESVNPGVSVRISEMNAYRWGGGFNRIDTGDISWAEAVSGMYRYIH